MQDDSEFKKYYIIIIDSIYAFIIGESFLELDPLFVEIKKFFEFENLVDVGALILAYSMVIGDLSVTIDLFQGGVIGED